MFKLSIVLLILPLTLVSQVLFEGMDLSWINGQNRQKDLPLVLKDNNQNVILTGVAYLDGYFNYDFNRPIDNTHTISSSIGRSNEFTLNLASVGLESNYKNVIGRIWPFQHSGIRSLEFT